MKRERYIVWSSSADEGQVLIDIIPATCIENAENRVARARTYATIDGCMELAEHIAALQKSMAKPFNVLNDEFRSIY